MGFMVDVAFIAPSEDPQLWLPLLQAALPEARWWVYPQLPNDVGYAVVANPPLGVLASLPKLVFVQSLWAGLDGLLKDPLLPKVPIARLVDPEMTREMAETALTCVLMAHRQVYRYQQAQRESRWQPLPQPQPAQRLVGVLGLGELGLAALQALKPQGFSLRGYSRSPKTLAGVQTFAQGQLEDFLQGLHIAVCLLPLTAQTKGLFNRHTLSLLAPGAVLINLARGAQVVEADVLEALDQGTLAHAYLDVFATEPLPAQHPFWQHPSVSLTPHIAAKTNPRTAALVVAQNLRRAQQGLEPLHLLKPEGY